MNNEFKQDFGESRAIADTIKDIANSINDIFGDVDSKADTLFSDVWNSEGADNARDRYNKIKENYELFYQKVLEMHRQVHGITDANQGADKSVSETFVEL